MRALSQDPVIIDASTCHACGQCGAVCPRHVIEVVEHDDQKEAAVVPERAELCLGCGHCAAVCPTGSITIDGLDNDAFASLSKMDIGDEQMLALLRQRRSVCRYKQRPIPRSSRSDTRNTNGSAQCATD